MLRTQVEEGSNLVRIDFSGTLDADEMQACHAALQRVIDERGSLRLLGHYGAVDLRRIEPRAFWEDLKNVKLIPRIDRCAIVADQAWLRRISDALGPLLPCELRTFDLASQTEALAWLRS